MSSTGFTSALECFLWGRSMGGWATGATARLGVSSLSGVVGVPTVERVAGDALTYLVIFAFLSSVPSTGVSSTLSVFFLRWFPRVLVFVSWVVVWCLFPIPRFGGPTVVGRSSVIDCIVSLLGRVHTSCSTCIFFFCYSSRGLPSIHFCSQIRVYRELVRGRGL